MNQGSTLLRALLLRPYLGPQQRRLLWPDGATTSEKSLTPVPGYKCPSSTLERVAHLIYGWLEQPPHSLLLPLIGPPKPMPPSPQDIS